ncbi:hypothetical protein J2128_002481 [Methanomicrobium sp. W14]|uniref:hypothetical protein n=1 Tax=Methanomicrobium sp. W14 TaxID=2817839 RepID=UPI001AE18F77|nr:hypothetical protein [Methanomicrobium sp. W14]MBP2134515.1 hypothetical protein [Methanomicrobium sp. W14]
MNEPYSGIIQGGGRGKLDIIIEDEHFYITPEDVKNLIFYGRSVPVMKNRTENSDEWAEIFETEIAGHVTMNTAGRSVHVVTVRGTFIIPLFSLQKVARGEVVSAPLFQIMPDLRGGVFL